MAIKGREPKYNRIDLDERNTIEFWINCGLSYRSIARKTERAVSSIYDEISRNGGYNHYNALKAHRQAKKNKLRIAWKGKVYERKIKKFIRDGLDADWSPQQIAMRMKLELPREYCVSCITIYRWIRNGLIELNTGKKYRFRVNKPRRRQKNKEKFSTEGRTIAQRPDEVENRLVPGHWEGDTIVSSMDGVAAVLTLVERTSRYLIAIKLPNKGKRVTSNVLKKVIKENETIFKTITFDQGSEFAGYADVEEKTNVKIYFADAGHPEQRGTNENTNGLLRFYFPKKTNFEKVKTRDLRVATKKINTRPRVVLDGYNAMEKLKQMFPEENLNSKLFE